MSELELKSYLSKIRELQSTEEEQADLRDKIKEVHFNQLAVEIERGTSVSSEETL